MLAHGKNLYDLINLEIILKRKQTFIQREKTIFYV